MARLPRMIRVVKILGADRNNDSVSSHWTELDRKRVAEIVFEKHLEACTEDAPLFQFQGS